MNMAVVDAMNFPSQFGSLPFTMALHILTWTIVAEAFQNKKGIEVAPN